ncbi:EAL domain-containing protein [Roseomonas sp. M0104]|uniref:EAL domain-containing protein n=1 Tax=Teichococcus coralli TaxID=2545983 RepID=A0A845B935_9PROT|nr:EAL domain-containing protein [Pseudoroseomonas coralli]MXP63691.1 EAL domain-containing protein [Pseudoroseomonas coralli]
MLRVYTCLTQEHDLRLVLLAGLVDLAGTLVALGVLRRARGVHGLSRAGWLVLAGMSGGAAIWCTHFIAMLAYMPSPALGFAPTLTLVSLVVAMLGCGLSFGVAVGGPPWASLAGGALLGLSGSAMHYIGMAAYGANGILAYDGLLVGASVLLAVLFCMAALFQALQGDGWRGWLEGGLLFCLGIAALHFTGMGAIEILPAPRQLAKGSTAQEPLALAVGVVALLVVSATATAWLIDRRNEETGRGRMRQLALHDGLTGLPNRLAFSTHLSRQLGAARSGGGGLALLWLGLNRFSQVNDLYGQAAGDAALRDYAHRLDRLRPEGGMAARMGSDEFGLLQPYGSRHEVEMLVSRLEAMALLPGEARAGISAAIGVALFPHDGGNAEALMANAALAMRRAKAMRAGRACFYDAAEDASARDRLRLADDLRLALERAEFRLFYQPQAQARSRRLCGHEALMRWHHPERGLIAPGIFIPLAEETGLILALGEWALRTACAEAAAEPRLGKVAVNLSPLQFRQPGLPELVAGALAESGLPAARLELEITESVMMRDPERAVEMLQRMKRLGISVAMDDFGTGYSSLATLRAFPFDKIKLDRSFIPEIESDPQARAILRAVLGIGRGLGIPVLAEGVETEAQLATLRDEGCAEIQGYLLGAPCPLSMLHFPAARAATA